ncbi:jg12180 [Pararge aegeria aegeria]|uniref:Jg12180 protein n=1 Tax=Pararge aegeria aegeria TaxID=348720 RepID=A0A8S4RB78_9NEOP|nr:jg12180 [Pararge aegeria aegeria]
MVIAKSKRVNPHMNTTVKNMDYNWTPAPEPPNNQEVAVPRAVFIPHSNSLPFDERRVSLEQPVKIGRNVYRATASPTNTIFECRVLSRHHATLYYEKGHFYLVVSFALSFSIGSSKAFCDTAYSGKYYCYTQVDGMPWNGSPEMVSAALVGPQRGGQTTLSASQVAAGFKRLRTLELGTPYKRPMFSSGCLSVLYDDDEYLAGFVVCL